MQKSVSTIDGVWALWVEGARARLMARDGMEDRFPDGGPLSVTEHGYFDVTQIPIVTAHQVPEPNPCLTLGGRRPDSYGDGENNTCPR